VKKIELLAPAGNFEKLEIAIHYGADAVYLGGKDFSLRNFSGNFTTDELNAAVRLAHQHKVRVYVACNIYSRNEEQDAIAEYLEQLGEINPDALIIADPGIFAQARSLIPHIPIHISTQANTTNYNTALFWKNLGAARIVAARELSLKELSDIAQKAAVEIESFVHGAMCISYSGRCLLSAFMANRDSNRGLCCHPCRWNYAVVEETRPGQYFPIAEDQRGTYLFNSKDLCMISHIPEMIEAGISSLKIEGRMKGINYVGATVKTYREAIDAYYENPETYAVKQDWLDELDKINYREYCTGFYFSDSGQTVPNYEEGVYSTKYLFAGKILRKNADDVVIEVRNKISVGDTIEILRQKGAAVREYIRGIRDESGQVIPIAQSGSRVFISIDSDCSPNDLIRRVDV